MKQIWFFMLILTTLNTSTTIIRISKNDIQRIGHLIWKNECGGAIEGLTYWVKGEPCASLGIGHFIWYPKNATGITVHTNISKPTYIF